MKTREHRRYLIVGLMMVLMFVLGLWTERNYIHQHPVARDLNVLASEAELMELSAENMEMLRAVAQAHSTLYVLSDLDSRIDHWIQTDKPHAFCPDCLGAPVPECVKVSPIPVAPGPVDVDRIRREHMELCNSVDALGSSMAAMAWRVGLARERMMEIHTFKEGRTVNEN